MSTLYEDQLRVAAQDTLRIARNAETSRAVLDGEIFRVDDPAQVAADAAAPAPFGRERTQAAMDLEYWNLLQEAKAAQASGPADGLEGEWRKNFVPDAKKRLRVYGEYRKKRGEKPFQYLERGQQEAEVKRWNANLPTLVQLFSGPDKMADGMAEADRLEWEDSFKHSLDPARDKMQAANMRFVSEMTRRPLHEIAPAWSAIRTQYAQRAFGLSGVVDEKTFYQTAGKHLTKERDDGSMMEKVHARAAALALQGKTLADSLEETKRMAGDRWPEFSQAARSGHATTLARFSDDEIQAADALWNEFLRIRGEDGKSNSIQAPDGHVALVQYGRMDQGQRENLMNIIAMRAQAEGEDVTQFFARFGTAFRTMSENIGSSVLAMGAAAKEERIRKYLEKGEIPAEVPEGGITDYEDAPVFAPRAAKDMRKLTAEERAMFEQAADFYKGRRAWLTDLPHAGIRAKRYLDTVRDGFWDTVGDWSVMVGESLPLMALATVPYGGGLALNAAYYAEDNMAQLRKENPGMDNATMEHTAYAAALGMAGIDRLQVNLMGARLPKLQAWAARSHKLLRYPARAAIMTGVSTGAEFGQEIGQDLTLPVMSSVVSALSEDLKGPDWQAVMQRERDALGDIFGVSLLFGIIGGAGHTVADVMSLPKLKETLTDRQGLAVAGHTAETIERVATEAETNPLAAAETLKAAAMETPVEVRRENSRAAVEAMRENPPPTAQEAALPEIIEDEDGIRVKYPDGSEDPAHTMEDAVAALRTWEADDSNVQEHGIRQMLRHLETSHDGNPELAAKGNFRQATELTFADWAKGSNERINQAYARVRILMRNEFSAGERETDGSELANSDIDLSQYLILGASRNSYGQGVTRIAMEINRAQQGTGRAGATVLTPLEEHAEGVGKFLIQTGKKSLSWMIGNIRAMEAATRQGVTMADNLAELSHDLQVQEVAEAFSRLAVANATGRIQDSSVPAGLKSIFRAIKESIKAILELAVDIRAFRESGKADAEFGYWLDVAGGVNEDYTQENLVRQMEADMIADAMVGMPEIRSAIAGKLPHPETLEENGHPLAGEVRAVHDEIKQSQDSGANQSARTRKANDFFLPVGEMVDLDQVRESLNEQGFDFQTPAEMIDSLMLSVGYAKPQYGTGGGMETFSISRAQAVEIRQKIEAQTPIATETGSLPDLSTVAKVKQWAKASGVYGETNHPEITGPIQIAPSSIKSEIGHRLTSRKAATLAVMKELIPISTYVESHRRNQTTLSHRLAGMVTVDGVPYVARIVVDEDRNGTRLYNHELSDLKELHKSESPQPLQSGGAQEQRIGWQEFEDTGKLLHWIFSVKQTGETHSIARADSPLLKAIEALVVAPEKKAEVYKRMAATVRGVRQRHDKRRFMATGEVLEDTPDARHEELRDIATLEAVAKSLPPAIRGKLVGSFRKLDSLKTAKGREDYMIRLLPKIEQSLEGDLQKQYRQAIKRTMEKSRPKKNDSRTLRGKIGGMGHAIAKKAVEAMTLENEAAMKQAADIRDEINTRSADLTFEEFEEMEGKAMALELFADYQNADSARLEKALEFIKANYTEGRSEWLATLKERKEKRESEIEVLKRVLRAPDFITEEMLATAAAQDKRAGEVFGDALLEWISSAYQTLDRLKERATDGAAVAWVDQQQERLRKARGEYEDAVEAERLALNGAMREIFGTRAGWLGEFELDPILYDLSKGGHSPVTILEGFKRQDVTVPISFVEALVNGETSGFQRENGTMETLDDDDVQALSEAWEAFQDLPEEAQKGKRTVRFERIVSHGKRGNLGEISQLEGLKEWLAMRQPDAAKKYGKIGWDGRTFRELDQWLKPEVKELGLWMVDRLAEQAPALDALHRSEFGIGLDLVENYFPLLFNAGADKEANVSPDGADVAVRAKTASALKSRVGHRARPRRMNAVSVFLSNRAQIHYFMSHAETLREMLGVFRSREANEAISATLGPNYLNTLSKELKLIETNGVMQADGVLVADRFVRKIQSGYALGVLGMKLKTLLVNTTAVWNTLLGVPVSKLVKGMTPEYLNDLRAVFESPAMQRRLKHGTSHEMRVAMQGGVGGHPLAAGSRRGAQAPMQAINVVDSTANTLTMALAYRATLEEARAAGLPEEMAKVQAENEVDRLSATVAQPNNLLSRSMGEVKFSQHPFGGLLFLFASETRKNLAIGLYAARKLATGKGAMSHGMAAQQLIVLGLFYSATGYLLRSLYQSLFKADDDDPEEILKRWGARLTDAKAWTNAMATEHLKGIPLIGEALNHGFAGMVNSADFIPGEKIKTMDTSPNPLNKFVAGVDKAADALNDEKTAEDRVQATIDAIQFTMAITPETAVLAQAGNVSEDVLGFLHGNGMAISDDGRVKRIKARMSKLSREMDEQLGKTTGADGKVNKEIQAKKHRALADKLRAELAPLSPDLRKKVLESKIAPDAVIEAAGFSQAGK